MDFLLKKIVGLLIQPLPIVLVLLMVGLVFLWRRRESGSGRRLLLAGTVLLLLASMQYAPFVIGRALETSHAAYQPQASVIEPEYVVVLGGGAVDDPNVPLSSRLSPMALARLVEGVRIAREYPEARLVVSGGAVFTSVSEADVAASVAEMLGVDSLRIVRERRSLDTEDQARLLRGIVGRRPFVLVTSAVHMPRSVGLFRKQGMEPIPAPTAYLFGSELASGPRTFLPTAQSLRELEIVLHEVYGLLWARLRGKI